MCAFLIPNPSYDDLVLSFALINIASFIAMASTELGVLVLTPQDMNIGQNIVMKVQHKT